MRLASAVALASLVSTPSSCALENTAFTGTVYGVALNGTTNLQQFFAADLNTFVVAPVGPPLGEDIDVIGGAAAVDQGIFWTSLYIFGPNNNKRKAGATTTARSGAGADEIALTGINTTTGLVVYSYNSSAWIGMPVFIVGIFVRPQPSAATGTQLFVIAKEPRLGTQVFVNVDGTTGKFSVLGKLDYAPGGDAAWDPVTGLVYEVATDGSDDDSGNMTVIATQGAGAPKVLGGILLENFFDLPHWDPQTGSLVGLTLATDPAGNYGRNLTMLFPQQMTYNISVRAELSGGFYALYDGPKAFDEVGRRAFYVIATSPMGALDLVTVNVDTGAILESPQVCGFIGYCPGAIAYSDS